MRLCLVLFMQTFCLLFLDFFFFEKLNERVLVGCKRFGLGTSSKRLCNGDTLSTSPHLTTTTTSTLEKRARLHTPREIICSKDT